MQIHTFTQSNCTFHLVTCQYNFGNSARKVVNIFDKINVMIKTETLLRPLPRVHKSRQIDFRQCCCLFNSVITTSKTSLTAGSFVFIYVTCPK